MQLSRNNVRPVTSNASHHTSGLQEDGSDLLEKPKKGMKQNAKQKERLELLFGGSGWWLEANLRSKTFNKFAPLAALWKHRLAVTTP